MSNATLGNATGALLSDNSDGVADTPNPTPEVTQGSFNNAVASFAEEAKAQASS